MTAKNAQPKYIEAIFNCNCPSELKTVFSVKHAKKPLKEMETIIQNLIWYAPNVYSSTQSMENLFLKDKELDEFVFSYFMYILGLETQDCFFVCSEYLDDKLKEVFQYKPVCTQCSKIILTKKDNETKITCVLRHVRNCVAHGNINFLDKNKVLGYDTKNGRWTGLVKSIYKRFE